MHCSKRMNGSKANIAVLGAGVIGLSTATCIQESLKSTNVTIIADKFLQETLSIGAGGLFRPGLECGSTLETIKQYYKDSYEYFVKLHLSENNTGVQYISGYHLSSICDEDCRNECLSELLPDVRQTPVSELNLLFPEKYKYGYFYTTIVADPRYYLPWLQQKFLNAGGTLIQKHITDLQSEPLLNNFDAIVNCTGFGAKHLCRDWKLVPIRGQTIKVDAPWIKHFCFADGAYIIPGADGLVTLGAIKQYGDTETTVREEDRITIWNRCTELMPSLKSAKICWNWCGLRPHRQTIRVEDSSLELNGKTVPLIHNYGHGGNGISLSYGTALSATNLLSNRLLQTSVVKSKL